MLIHKWFLYITYYMIVPVLNTISIFFSSIFQSNISFDLRRQFFMKFVSIKPFFSPLLKRCYLIIKKGWICKFGSYFIYCTPHPYFFIFFCLLLLLLVGCIQRKRYNVSTQASINPLECRIFCVFPYCCV